MVDRIERTFDLASQQSSIEVLLERSGAGKILQTSLGGPRGDDLGGTVSQPEQFTWSERGGVAVVSAPGEIDLSNAAHLREICRDAVDEAGPRLVVDLSRTSFMDSTALGVFVGLSKHVKPLGGWIRLVTGESTAVKKVLRMTALDGILGNYSAVEDAMSADVASSRQPVV